MTLYPKLAVYLQWPRQVWNVNDPSFLIQSPILCRFPSRCSGCCWSTWVVFQKTFNIKNRPCLCCELILVLYLFLPGSGTLCASWQCLEVPRGPPPSLAVQFVGSGASLSGMDVELVGSRYRMSLVKKRFATGDVVDTQALMFWVFFPQCGWQLSFTNKLFIFKLKCAFRKRFMSWFLWAKISFVPNTWKRNVQGSLLFGNVV